MNKQFKLLAEQAEFSETDLHIQGDNFQKFAELIIHDCTNIIANQGKFLGYVALEEKVKKHFGIDSPK
jgi:hypothetical protein